MKNIKNYILTVMAVLMMLVSVNTNTVKAATHVITTKTDSSWKLNGNMYGVGTLIYCDGEISFCLDSLKPVATGNNKEVSYTELGLTKKDVNNLSLIVWYGYRSKAKPTNTDYFLTQNLIWEYLGYPGDFASSSTYPTKASMRSVLDDIMYKVEHFGDLPSFNGKSFTANAGETLTITDTNKVLSGLNVREISGAKVVKSGNTLKITPDSSKSSLTIVFDRGLTAEQTKTNFIVRSGTSQPVSQCFSGQDPYLSRITVKVNNKTNLQIAKKDPNDKLVPNTSFKLSYNSDMSNPIGTYTTGSNGTVVVENILIKDIYIQEVSVPSYLKLDKTIYKKTLSYSDGMNYYTAKNDWNLVDLQIAKKDPNEKLIANTSFKLSYNSDMSNPIGTYTTGSNGTVTVKNLLVKDVYIQEVSVPSHLKLDKTIYKKTLVSDVLNYYTAKNNWNVVDLQLAKKDPDGNLIAGTSFKLSYNSDMSNPIGTYTTKSDGKVFVEDLLVKDIYIQEVAVPSYLKLDKTIYKKTLSSDVLNYYTAKNDWNLTDLQLAKKDPDGNLIAGTSFKLSYNSDMSDPIGTYTTKSDGKVIVEDLLVKDIYIQEVSVPDYLKLDETIYKKTLSSDVLNYYTATNDWNLGTLKIAKKDSTGEYVAGVTFKISYNQDMSGNTWNHTTGKDGTVEIPNLLVGKVYIQEINVPDRLHLDDKIYSVDIIPNETTTYEAINECKEVDLQIAKKDKDGNLIANTTFKISYNSDMSNPIGTYTTGSKGSVIVEDLLVKDIYIQEISVPNYLKLDKTIYKKSLVPDKLNYYTAVNEFKKGNLEIYKRDNKGNDVTEVSFKVSYNYDMSDPIGIYSTGLDGRVFVDNLDAKYVYIQEIAVPDNLELDSNVYAIKIKPETVVVFEMVNNIKDEYLMDIYINKRVTGTAADNNKDFHFMIYLNDTSLNGFYGDVYLEYGIGVFTLSDMQTIALKGLPKGVSYTISENDYSDYLTTVKLSTSQTWTKSNSISGQLNKSIQVEFNNNKDLPVPTGVKLNTGLYVSLVLSGLGISTAILMKKKENE